MISYQYVIAQIWLLQEPMYLEQMNQFNDALLGLDIEELVYILLYTIQLPNEKGNKGQQLCFSHFFPLIFCIASLCCAIVCNFDCSPYVL